MLQFPASVGRQPLNAGAITPNTRNEHPYWDFLQERQPDFIQQIRDLLSTIEPSQSISLAEAARRLHTSERGIQQKLKDRNTSFHRLYLDSRMLQAKQLILDSDLNISEVATRFGYSDVSGFSRAFKNSTGSSPKQFRKHHLQQNRNSTTNP